MRNALLRNRFADSLITGFVARPQGYAVLLHQGVDMPVPTEGADTRIACGVIRPGSAASHSMAARNETIASTPRMSPTRTRNAPIDADR